MEIDRFRAGKAARGSGPGAKCSSASRRSSVCGFAGSLSDDALVMKGLAWGTTDGRVMHPGT